jgi:hypothetical protein
MAKQGNCMLIDIQYDDTGAGEKSGTPSHLRQVRYVALDEMEVVHLDKLYGSATPQNSIDFLKRVNAHVRIPINSILIDSGPAFYGALIKYLAECGIQHKRNVPYVPAECNVTDQIS